MSWSIEEKLFLSSDPILALPDVRVFIPVPYALALRPSGRNRLLSIRRLPLS